MGYAISKAIMNSYQPPSSHPDNIQSATKADNCNLKNKLQNTFESGKDSVSSCYGEVCKSSSQICETAGNEIRKNPVASVIGAAFVGAAVCYLIMESRHQPTFRDRYVSDPLSNASNKVNDSLGSMLSNLKFW